LLNAKRVMTGTWLGADGHRNLQKAGFQAGPSNPPRRPSEATSAAVS